MKKKLLLLTVVAVSGFLLSACDPIDAITGWRDSFFSQASSAQIIEWFRPVVIILAVGILVAGLVGANSVEKYGWAQVISVPLLLFLALIMTLIFLEITTILAHRFLPETVTLDWVLDKLQVEMKLDFSEVVYAVWSANTASMVPKLFQIGTFTLLMGAYLAIGWSILRRNSQGFVFLIASWVGVTMFLVLWVAFIKNFGVIFPDTDTVLNKALMGLSFVGGTSVLFAICFYGLPVSALIWIPIVGQAQPRVEAPSSEAKIEGSKDKNIDLRSIISSIFGGFVGSQMGDQEEAEPLKNDDYKAPKKEQKFLPDPDVLDGEYHEIDDDWPPSRPSPKGKGPSSEPVIIMGSGPVSKAPSSSSFPESGDKWSPPKMVFEGPEASLEYKYKPKASKPTSNDPVISQNPVIKSESISESPKVSVEHKQKLKARYENPVIINETREKAVDSKKQSPLTAKKVAASADVVSSAAIVLGQPELALAAQIVGARSSSYAAKEATKRKIDDPVIRKEVK